MAISISKDGNYILLSTARTSYLMGVSQDGFLAHLYYGDLLKISSDEEWESFSYLMPEPMDEKFQVNFYDTFPFEYPVRGYGNYSDSCMEIEAKDGNEALDFTYDSVEYLQEKPELPGLPATFGIADTIKIKLKERKLDVDLILTYSVFEQEDAITKSVELVNNGAEEIYVKKIMSGSLTLPVGDYECIHLPGAWGRERAIVSQPVTNAKQVFESTRGVSSHQMNPFIAITSKGANEDYGNIYAMNFVYSGNFYSQVEEKPVGSVVTSMGIHPYNMKWKLMQGESFVAPELVYTFSSAGIGRMTRNFHELYKKHLIRDIDKKRPVLVNNWEATYFDFDEEALLEIADVAKECGIEMLVMDDGWFGKRDDDTTSLGDWYVDDNKLPNGLDGLARRLANRQVKFGIWMEPEMVSKESKLYQVHPDWIIQQEGRETSQARSQYVLDLSKYEVRKEIYRRIKHVIASADIQYLKWDMNRNLSHVPEGEIYHRYVLGLYEMFQWLRDDFPDLLLEHCSSGGGRFDPGMLYYGPQIWTSDMTDAIERTRIQRGTAMVYPLSTMGAHLSVCPNHVTARTVSFDTRGQMALFGGFGYELDLRVLSEEEKEKVREQIAFYKEHYELLKNGDYYRLDSEYEGKGYDAFMVVSKDKTEALLSYVNIRPMVARTRESVKLKGLLPERRYSVSGFDKSIKGEVLMKAGLQIKEAEHEYESALYYIKDDTFKWISSVKTDESDYGVKWRYD